MTTNQTLDSALDAAVERVMEKAIEVEDFTASPDDLKQVIRTELEARYEAGVTAGRRDAGQHLQWRIDALREGIAEALLAVNGNDVTFILKQALKIDDHNKANPRIGLATPTETKPTEGTR